MQGVQLTEASYTTLIQALGEHGNVDDAVKSLDVMVEEGLQPNVITYAAAMAACRDRPETVLSLLSRMRNEKIEPNTVVLTTAINSLARAGGRYSDHAAGILQHMEKYGPEPNIYTYNTITRAYAEAGRLDDAVGVLRDIKNRNLAPDRYTFTTLLIACGRMNQSDKVDVVMNIMEEAGVEPDAIIYGAAIDAHRRANNSLLAVECLQDMYRHQLEPNAAHFNLVLRTLKAEGFVDKMFKMVMALTAKDDSKVNGNTFEIVMEAMLEKGKWKEPLILLRTMDKFGLKASMAVCVGLAELLERARQYKAVLALYKVMVRYGYDFYENDILNGVFKRLVSVAAKGVQADIDASASATVQETPTLRVEEEVCEVSTVATMVENLKLVK